jgi:hypothetical protein
MISESKYSQVSSKLVGFSKMTSFPSSFLATIHSEPMY